LGKQSAGCFQRIDEAVHAHQRHGARRKRRFIDHRRRLFARMVDLHDEQRVVLRACFRPFFQHFKPTCIIIKTAAV